MKYTFTSNNQDKEIIINIVDSMLFNNEHATTVKNNELLEINKKPCYCRAFLLKDNILGNFHIIKYDGSGIQRYQFAFCLSKNEVLFVDDDGYVKDIVSKMHDTYEMQTFSTVKFLHDFIAEMIKEDSLMIADIEEALNDIEDSIVNDNIYKLDNKISKYRYHLLKLGLYYHQLEEMIDTLLDNEYDLLNQKETFIFKTQERRVNRLSDHVESLREYTSQLNDMFDSKQDTKQNHAINVLTILTSIFFPLSIITGWYGMNFVNMPELKTNNGYFVIIGVSVLVVVLELIVLKIRKIL